MSEGFGVARVWDNRGMGRNEQLGNVKRSGMSLVSARGSIAAVAKFAPPMEPRALVSSGVRWHDEQDDGVGQDRQAK